MATRKTSGSQSQNFESSLAALESVVRELERGDLPLERSLELFERGVRLSRECQERLNEAERRIEILLRDADGRSIARSFDRDEFAQLEDGREEEAEDNESVF